MLEDEAAINAFASGYAPTDAAVTVTRGALDKLTREELQGVIGRTKSPAIVTQIEDLLAIVARHGDDETAAQRAYMLGLQEVLPQRLAMRHRLNGHPRSIARCRNWICWRLPARNWWSAP